jgi:uncharacterized lipoprotein NlpE involved in copper resistance
MLQKSLIILAKTYKKYAMNRMIYLFGFILIASCGFKHSTNEEVEAEVEWFGPQITFIPGTYKAEFACADCPGISTLIQFDADGKAVISRFYKDRSTEPELTFGRWVEANGNIQFTGHYEQDTLLFRSHEKGLVLLDKEGQYVFADNLVAARTEESISLADPFSVAGRFFYMADAAVFWFHPDEQPVPVVMNEAYLPLEKAYLLVGESERNCIRARLVVKLINTEDMEGNERPHLEVIRFIHLHAVQCKE